MPLTICTSRTEWYALLTMAPPPPPPGRDDEVLKELRRPHGQNHAGHAPEDVHIHHQANPQFRKRNLNHHRERRLEELAHVGLEHTFVIVNQTNAGQRNTHSQNQDFKPAHQELEIQDEIDDDKYQPKMAVTSPIVEMPDTQPAQS